MDMINFTVGPVQSSEAVREIGSHQVPYFRTSEFSDVMFENEALIKKFAKAPEGSRVVFITGSGSASMEASIMNTLSASDKVLVVNGGSFGHRFVELLQLHQVPFEEIALEAGPRWPRATWNRSKVRASRRLSSTCTRLRRACCTT